MKTSATKTRAKAKKPVSKDIGFRKGDFVVYPTHGVGRVLGVETQEISGHTLHVIITSGQPKKVYNTNTIRVRAPARCKL